MASKIRKEDATRFLSDVPAERVFFVNDGRILRNLNDLSACLSDISKEAFMHHVNKEKNDFFNWITEIIQDNTLAKQITAVKTSTGMKKKVDARIAALNKAL